MGDIQDIAVARLPKDVLEDNFSDVKPLLDRKTALIESSRCYFCYDAPCVEACPTGIDIPNFIRKISTDNVRGAAEDILSENILGGSCARVCPTEILCEEVCVRTTQENKPVSIGRLQRYATDWLMDRDGQPFERAASSGKKIAVVGAGPAGLSAAHRLSMQGHDVIIFEARQKPGGLNEYGIAAYKVPEDFAAREVAFVLGIGGIEIQYGKTLGDNLNLPDLKSDFDAVFLGLGLAAVRALGMDGENLSGVYNAVDYISELRQSDDLQKMPVGRNVVVIGGGNTAIDIAIQTKRLGAENVTLAYRRGSEHMSATGHEQEFAQTNGVIVKHWASPRSLKSVDGHVSAVEFAYTGLNAEGKLVETGESFEVASDMVFKAIGQVLDIDQINSDSASVDVKSGKIITNENGMTSIDGVFAGGDCVMGNEDLTVAAVQDGKLAAHAISTYLAK
jgi:dihydropyrimidine dehydrogenase (NAD+) subunit PreT